MAPVENYRHPNTKVFAASRIPMASHSKENELGLSLSCGDSSHLEVAPVSGQIDQ